MLLQKHQESWANDFNQIKNVINKSCIDIKIEIEHVGSTAIVNLATKPIIDIDIVYDESTNFEEVKKRLAAIGYYHNGDQGIKGREAFKRVAPVERHEVLDFIQHHLYVCSIHSEELKRHTDFRNYLNKNEKERKEYEELKKEIAKEANQDRKIYAKIKEYKAREFIESVLKKANFD